MESQTRQTAIKARISNLLNGRYIVNEGWEPNHILYNSQKISRVNIIGVVVSKNQNEFSSNASIVIDDGSGRINVRSFEENLFINNSAVGDVVLLIGRPREYSNEIYIMPEIIKPLDDKRWVDVRKLELGQEEIIEERPREMQEAKRMISMPSVVTRPVEDEKKDNVLNIKQEAQPESHDAVDEKEMTSTKIIRMIKEKDTGSGADFEAVISSANDAKAEEVIQNLLKNGDIFELKPGKLKVLE